MDPAAAYSVALALAMAAALVGQPAIAVIWPSGSRATGASSVLVIVCAGLTLAAFFWLLRQLGPLSISRSDATWLLPAPVSRRKLLSPALGFAVAGAALIGGLTGSAVTGRIVDRPAPTLAVVAGITGGAAITLFVMLAAVHCQRRPALGRIADLVFGAMAGVLMLVAIGIRTIISDPSPAPALQPGPPVLVVTCAGLAAAIGGVLLAARALEGWPTHRILATAANAGAYADAVYAMEPSFLAAASTRRFWRRQGVYTPTKLFRRNLIPPLVAQDLLLARRKSVRLWWLAGTAAVPTLIAEVPSWLLVGALLLGALGAAGLTTESTHSDAGNPAMLRLLNMSGRRAIAQRLVMSSAIASIWLGVALTGLQIADRLDGPWWMLGIVAGPAIAVAALQRAKVSSASIGHVLIDTPLGAFPSGAMLWLVNGVDVLALLTLPISITLVSTTAPERLGWPPLLTQVIASTVGCLVLVRRSAANTGQLVTRR